MRRNAIDKLISWKQLELRTPFFLYGVRNCGKTYLAMDFAKSFFEGILYVNFEDLSFLKLRLEHGCRQLTEQQNQKSPLLFAEDFYSLLAECFDVPAEYLGNFLIVFDEVMASSPVYQVICSIWKQEWTLCLLLISSHGPELPANIAAALKQNIHHLTPLQFDEFLVAIGSEWYAEVIKGHYQTIKKVPTIVHNELMDLFLDYLHIGGMPAAVNDYLLFHSTDNIHEVHRNLDGILRCQIQMGYEKGQALKMLQILDVIPEQLAKENQKFQFRMIRKGVTLAMYHDAIQNLLRDSMILCCTKLNDSNSFKLFPADVGLLYSSRNTAALMKDTNENTGLNISAEVQGQAIELQKELLDSYVMQTLVSSGYQPVFWESASQAKIDFILQREEGAIPVEVKAGESSRSKSLSIYRSQCNIPYSIKISSRNFEFTNQIKYIPYYAVFCL